MATERTGHLLPTTGALADAVPRDRSARPAGLRLATARRRSLTRLYTPCGNCVGLLGFACEMYYRKAVIGDRERVR
jgi:hypothetical protein